MEPFMSWSVAALTTRHLPPALVRLPAILKTSPVPVASANVVLAPPDTTRLLPSPALPMLKLLEVGLVRPTAVVPSVNIELPALYMPPAMTNVLDPRKERD